MSSIDGSLLSALDELMNEDFQPRLFACTPVFRCDRADAIVRCRAESIWSMNLITSFDSTSRHGMRTSYTSWCCLKTQ